jgi:hypothetical protein
VPAGLGRAGAGAPRWARARPGLLAWLAGLGIHCAIVLLLVV